MIRAIALASLLSACSLLPRPHAKTRAVLLSSTDECRAINRRVVALTSTSVLAGAFGGSLSAISPNLHGDGPVYGTAGAGAGLSAVGAFTAYLASYFAQEYTQSCSINTGGIDKR